MNLLLDTHTLIWALNEDPKLSGKARELILDPDNAIYYSAVSVWEIAIKHALHPENVAFTGKEILSVLPGGGVPACRDAGQTCVCSGNHYTPCRYPCPP